jgi:hypothetical protein
MLRRRAAPHTQTEEARARARLWRDEATLAPKPRACVFRIWKVSDLTIAAITMLVYTRASRGCRWH